MSEIATRREIFRYSAGALAWSAFFYASKANSQEPRLSLNHELRFSASYSDSWTRNLPLVSSERTFGGARMSLKTTPKTYDFMVEMYRDEPSNIIYKCVSRGMIMKDERKMVLIPLISEFRPNAESGKKPRHHVFQYLAKFNEYLKKAKPGKLIESAFTEDILKDNSRRMVDLSKLPLGQSLLDFPSFFAYLILNAHNDPDNVYIVDIEGKIKEQSFASKNQGSNTKLNVALSDNRSFNQLELVVDRQYRVLNVVFKGSDERITFFPKK